MRKNLRWAKAHSELVANEYLRLGWRLVTELRVSESGEPYEWLLEWSHPTFALIPRMLEPHDCPLEAGSIPATDLEYWAALGRLKNVAEALAENPDANIRGVGGYTAMHAAALNGHVDVIQFLVSRGAWLNPQLDTGETPLVLAQMAEQHTVVSLLLSLGAQQS